MSCKRTLVDTAIFEGATMRRLEIGPGTNPLGGFDSLDVLGNPTYRAEWGSDPLPIEDESYDYVYASHCIEHVPWYRTDFALSEVSRILKPGGVVEIHTVDFALLVKAYRSESVLDAWTCHGFNEQLEPLKWVASRLVAYQKGDTKENWHRAIFSPRFLHELMTKVGLIDVQEMDRADVRGYDHGWINLGFRGTKR